MQKHYFCIKFKKQNLHTNMYDIILCFITAFSVTFLALPSIIRIAIDKGLCDMPGERRSHKTPTPSLGGIGIFAGLLFSIVFWTDFERFGDLQYILCAILIIFLIGAKDDIESISPYKKLYGELIAAAILVFKSNVKITSLYGIFGITEINDWVAIPLSIFIIIVIINAFNLIDGINGLSGSIGMLVSCTLGAWFYLTQNSVLAILSFSLAGAILAFLKFNFTPAKIFMGDTGALLLGLVCSILAIKFIELHKGLESPYAFKAVPAVAISILILPLFDTLRVFTVRILKGKSPFYPDRTHIHHLVVDLGLSHLQATGALILTNIAFIGLALALQDLGTFNLLMLILVIASALTAMLFNIVAKKNKTKEAV
jgi:UDP-GlcNAc:undecaprenyl-phosphate/decaprenyl-phosphate GlcNAc-1-phosphate transferase